MPRSPTAERKQAMRDIDDEAPGQEPVRTAAPWALFVFAILFALFYFRALPLELDPVRAANADNQFNASRAIATSPASALNASVTEACRRWRMSRTVRNRCSTLPACRTRA